MSAIYVVVSVVCIFFIAYKTYGTLLFKTLRLSNSNVTPAHTMNDGVDYVPTKAPVLLGHHFASIAGAGPIVGPVLAAQFGWLPVLMWIIIGSVFFGAVHDMTSLVSSVRHQGKSIGEVIKQNVGLKGKRLFLVFAMSTLILLIGAFAIVISQTFVRYPATATASILFIGLALTFGVVLYRTKWPLWITTPVAVAVLYFCVYLGVLLPIHLSFQAWTAILLVYIFAASTAPVWILLQPRDYLNSFLLYGIMLGGLIGIAVMNPRFELPAVTHFNTRLGALFPILFITVACGAISGFHSLVSSGTSSKQLNKETDAKLIGYGGMLIEGVLAVIALVTAAYLSGPKFAHFFAKGGGGPIALFSSGVGAFISKLGVPAKTGITFSALAISAFALTTLDTSARLCRFAFQEFFEDSPKERFRLWFSSNRFISTTAVIVLGGILAFSGEVMKIWPMFGAANQLLAALALLAATIWMKRKAMLNWMVRWPMYFMFIVTLTALVFMSYHNGASIVSDIGLLVSHAATVSQEKMLFEAVRILICIFLFFVALYLAWYSLVTIRKKNHPLAS